MSVLLVCISVCLSDCLSVCLSVCVDRVQVYPTYLWAEEDLTLLEGSPVIAATQSMRLKLEAEYATVEEDLLDKFPEVWLVLCGEP